MPAEEKGIDVSLAISFVAGALRDEYDVGIICSEDTDLQPALELVGRDFPQKKIAVASWYQEPHATRRLWIKDISLAWFPLDYSLYSQVADYKRYGGGERYKPTYDDFVEPLSRELRKQAGA